MKFVTVKIHLLRSTIPSVEIRILILLTDFEVLLLESLQTSTGTLPQFRKNIYTKEIIDFILEQIASEKMTKAQVIKRYGIPKTTLYKWISKYAI